MKLYYLETKQSYRSVQLSLSHCAQPPTITLYHDHKT